MFPNWIIWDFEFSVSFPLNLGLVVQFNEQLSYKHILE